MTLRNETKPNQTSFQVTIGESHFVEEKNRCVEMKGRKKKKKRTETVRVTKKASETGDFRFLRAAGNSVKCPMRRWKGVSRLLCPVKSSYYPQPIGYVHYAPFTSNEPRRFPSIRPSVVLFCLFL